MANSLPPIPYKTRLVDSAGIITPQWAALMREMFARVGGTQAPSNTQLNTTLENIQEDITALEADVSDLNQGPVL